MILKEISEEEFNQLGDRYDVYFCSGCLFEEKDNLVAFPFYESKFKEPAKYFKVVQE